MAEPMIAPRVLAGHVTALRLFEVADSIDLVAAEAALAAQAAGRMARARLSATPAKAMEFGVPPLAVALDPVKLALASGEVEAAVAARLYDFGAVTLAVRVPATDVAWTEYERLAEDMNRLLGGDSPVWPRLLTSLRAAIAGSLRKASPKVLEEDFLIATVTQFDGAPKAAALAEQLDLVPLLSGEQRPLSAGARADLLRHRFSYYEDDLAVLTWDRAFLYEPRGERDVADVLEVANAQLLEMRYYDELLDDELPRMYDMVEKARDGLNIFASRRYAGLARRFHTLVAEVTELKEKVDNALQVTEDVYLARVYAAALETLRVNAINAAVDRKLAIIRDTYTALYDEALSARSEVMEVAVILLIMMEVVTALFRH